MKINKDYWRKRLRTWFASEQGNKCAICGEEFTPVFNPPMLDHCHEAKYARGALCGNCNRGLGSFRDRVDLLNAAIAYLERDYSKNPPHPQDEPKSAIGLSQRDFNYAEWIQARQPKLSGKPTCNQ